MLEFLKYINSWLKPIMGIAANLFKISLFIGIAISLLYFSRIDYLPNDLSIGDGFVFILVSSKFFLIYILLICSIYTIGMMFYFFLKFIKNIRSNFFLTVDITISNSIILLTYDICKSEFWDKFIIVFTRVFWSCFSVYFCYLFFWGKLINLLIFFVICFFLVLLVSMFKKLLKKQGLTGNEKFKQMGGVVFIALILPFWFFNIYMDAEVSNKLINFSISSMREESKNSEIYINNKHKDLFPIDIIKDSKDNYFIVKDAKIILRGIGRNALIEYEYENTEKELIQGRIEVPNIDIQISWENEVKK